MEFAKDKIYKLKQHNKRRSKLKWSFIYGMIGFGMIAGAQALHNLPMKQDLRAICYYKYERSPSWVDSDGRRFDIQEKISKKEKDRKIKEFYSFCKRKFANTGVPVKKVKLRIEKF